MSESDVAFAIAAGAMSGAGASVLMLLYNSAQERKDRHREHFARALEVVARYEEFPYVVRRREPGSPESERTRISTELRAVQGDLSYHCTWLQTESRQVADAYLGLVTELRSVTGTLIHDAWVSPPIRDDAGMNIQDLAPQIARLQPMKERYLEELAHHLSIWPRWLRRLVSRRPSTAPKSNGSEV